MVKLAPGARCKGWGIGRRRAGAGELPCVAAFYNRTMLPGTISDRLCAGKRGRTPMGDFQTITALARKTGVSSKALRYWEKLGLLPKASRSHNGYRIFPPETSVYIGFVRRSREMGLTLRQMKTVLNLARRGHSPCAAVDTWIAHRIAECETEIRSLLSLRQSLKKLQRCRPGVTHSRDLSKECCSLLVGLPEAQAFPPLVGNRDKPRGRNSACDSGR